MSTPRQPTQRPPLSAATAAELAGLRHRLHAEIIRCRRLEATGDVPPEVCHSLRSYDIIAGGLAGQIRTLLEAGQ